MAGPMYYTTSSQGPRRICTIFCIDDISCAEQIHRVGAVVKFYHEVAMIVYIWIQEVSADEIEGDKLLVEKEIP